MRAAAAGLVAISISLQQNSMATPEAEVLAPAEAAAASPCVPAGALALAPASETASVPAAGLGCVCPAEPGAALMLSMRVSTSLTATCRESFDRVDMT